MPENDNQGKPPLQKYFVRTTTRISYIRAKSPEHAVKIHHRLFDIPEPVTDVILADSEEGLRIRAGGKGKP